MSKAKSKDGILVILESPAKKEKVKKLLGLVSKEKYIVDASYGHIRDLNKKNMSIEIDNGFKPIYIVNDDKKQVISNLKREYAKCKGVLLACDFDREGEAIAWHLSEVLSVPKGKRDRLIFTEITKKGIEHAVQNIKPLDLNMFYSQQARRIIDRLIGYKISPLLWNNIQNTMKTKISLSAGRVQSVVNRLILEREEEIKNFKDSSYYKTDGLFIFEKNKIQAELSKKIEDKDTADKFLEICANSIFKVGKIKKTLTKKSPSAPFITSTLQQEVSNKFRIGPKQTMMVLQKLYENGLITYMRTDSVTISEEILDKIEEYIINKFGDKFHNRKQYKNKSKNSQEAHEAIRPCNIELKNLDTLNITTNGKYTNYDIKIYNLIWNRTIASQMTQAEYENIFININILKPWKKGYIKNPDFYFISKIIKQMFDGFMKVYKPYEDPENQENDTSSTNNSKSNLLVIEKKLKENMKVELKSIVSTEKFTKPKHLRFTEASLIKKLDELGIGRPSTYSSMVTTVQDRKYVNKKDIEGKDKKYNILKLEDFTIEESQLSIKINSEKQKLVPTDIGGIVNKFLVKNFDMILNYNFTAQMETDLDFIEQGKVDWVNVINKIYKLFNGAVLKLTGITGNKLEKNKHKRILGKDPKTNFEVCTYIAKFGPVVQLKNTDDLNNSKFAPLKEIKMEDVTLEQALELLRYPYKFGVLNNKDVCVCKGQYGIYIKFNKKNYSISISEENLTLDIIKDIIKKKDSYSNKDSKDGGSSSGNIIKKINNDIVIKSGKYGAYISYKNKENIKIYSKKKTEDLTLEDCNAIIKNYRDYKSKKK